MKYLYTLGVLIILILTSCYQEEVNKYTSTNPSLLFTKTEIRNGISFHWNESKASSFVEYIVTRNVQSTPAVKEVSNIKASSILARVKSRDEIQIKDTVSIEKAYYRLYINVGHQLLASDEIFHDFNNYFLSQSMVPNFLVDKINGKLYLLYPNKSIEIVDLYKLKLKLFKSNLSFNFNASASLGYDQFGNTEIYMPLDDKIIFLDGENLQAKDTINSIAKGVSIYNTVSDNYSNIYYTDGYGGLFGSVAIYNASTEKTLRIGDVNIMHRNLRVTNDGKYILVGSVSFSSEVSLYTMDSKNNVIATSRSKGIIDWQTNFMLRMANFSPTFITSGGFIYENQIMQKVFLGQNMTFSDFSPDDKYIYFASSSQKLISQVENKIPYNIIKSYQTKFFPAFFFIYENEIFSVGSISDPNTGATRILLEKLEL